MTKTASEVLEKHFGHFNPNHPIDCLGYAKGVHPDIEDIILAMEEYRNQPQPLPSDINDRVKILIKALEKIKDFNDELEEEYGDPGAIAHQALSQYNHPF